MRIGSRSSLALRNNLIRDKQNAMFKIELEKQKLIATKHIMDEQTNMIMRSQREGELHSNNSEMDYDNTEDSYEVDGDFDDF